MSEKLKNKYEGDTNVKRKIGATLLKTMNVFDIENAGIARSGKGNWSDFQLMGSSNKTEREHINSKADASKTKEALKQARRMSVGRKIMAMKSLNLEAA